MKSKLSLLVFALAGAGLWAQDPAPPPAAPAGAAALPGFPTITNREELRQRALRAALARDTNFTARFGTNLPAGPAGPAPAADAPAAAAPVPGVAAPGGIAVPGAAGPSVAVPSSGPGGTNAGFVAIEPPASAASATPEEIIQAGVINFPATDLNQVLTIYAELVNRTVLRPSALPAQTITLKTQTPLTKREAVQAFDAVLALNGIAMINVEDKFVKAVPVTQAGQEGAKFSKLDASRLPEFGQYVTHVVQLKYARPSELVQVLTPFSKIPNAAIPIDSSQIMVLRDYTENVKRMLEMIKEIDVVVPSEFIQEVIPIKYALASEIANALNSLSSGGGGASVGGTGTAGGATGASRGGRSFGTGFGSGSSRSGTSGGMNPYGQMGAMGSMGTMGGTPGAAGGGTFTDRLQQIIKRASVTGDIVVLGQTKIISDERTNSLLIFASREDMKMIKEVVSKLDVVLAQVLIEAVIIEVSHGKNMDLAFSYLQKPQTSGNATGAGALNNTRKFYSPGDLTGATNAMEGGFTYLFSWGNDLDVVVRALAGNNRSRVLQRPKIQTSHAVEANLFVGESRPYPTGSYYGGGAYGGYSSIQQLQIGVTLTVTPLINPDGLVVMDIHQTIENVKGSVNIANVGDVPITSRKEAMAKVAVRDRDTIMVGGLIDNLSTKSSSGLPWLMDIPLIGTLFKATSSQNQRGELVILMRPTVLPTPEVAAITANVEKEKLPGIRMAERSFAEQEEMFQQAADYDQESSRPGADGSSPAKRKPKEPKGNFSDYPLN